MKHLVLVGGTFPRLVLSQVFGTRFKQSELKLELKVAANRTSSSLSLPLARVEGPSPEQILVIDVGGTHIKITTSGASAVRKFGSGPNMTAREMVSGVKDLACDWKFNAVAIGYPGPVLHGRPLSEPYELGGGWVGFEFEKAFGCRVKLMNDAAMQAIGSYEGGKMLFLGLGTGLGSTLIADGCVEPMEIGHLPYKKKTYEDYLGKRGLKSLGKKQWRKSVHKICSLLTKAMEPDYIVIGGGNSAKIVDLPANCRLGDNSNAFKGGFRMWGCDLDASFPIESTRKFL